MIIGRGKPALDKINLKVIDQAQIIKAMEKGDIDVANDATGAMAKMLSHLMLVSRYYLRQA